MVFHFLPITSFAGRVRTLPANSQEMSTIHLMTGRSTVLRFSSPPKKVVVGNQNYFSIEFIDSDVTLQPLANTTSNLFVYGDGFNYGFILKVDGASDYDDLVFVRNKVSSVNFSATGKTGTKTVPKKDIRFLLLPDKKSNINIEGGPFKWNDSIKTFFADVFIFSKNVEPISTKSIKIQLLSGNQDLTSIKAVFEKDQLLPKSKGRVRIFANVAAKPPLKMKLQVNEHEEIFTFKWVK